MKMKCAILYIALWLSTTIASAQEWNLPWVKHPTADSTSQLLFKKTFTLHNKPQASEVYVVSAGRFIVYVNGYNVTTDVLEPATTNQLIRYDVSRFLRRDTNTVAVWYSPTPPCQKTKHQLALSLCGTFSEGKRFAISTDESWLCLPINTTTSGGEEIINGNDYVQDYLTGNCGVKKWSEAETSKASLSILEPDTWHTARRISRIQSYTYLDDQGNLIVYHFAKRFDGWVRLTLRGMHRGDTIRVNGLTYICSGEDDEQPCRRFTSSASSIAVVEGPKGFSRDNITNIEAIDIEEYLHRSYQY